MNYIVEFWECIKLVSWMEIKKIMDILLFIIFSSQLFVMIKAYFWAKKTFRYKVKYELGRELENLCKKLEYSI